jgi:glycosyltransferase involved in cell wall biosynthesis
MRNEDKMNTRLKFCYILPEYDPHTASHYFHLYELIKSIRKKHDVFLIIEKSRSGHAGNNNSNIYIQKFSFLPFRIIELFLLICTVRVKGYHTFYVHYSIMPAMLLLPFTIGKTKLFFWSCIKSKAFFSDIKFKWRNLIKIIVIDTPLKIIFRYSRIVTCSTHMKNYYITELKAKENHVSVLPNWINPSRFVVPNSAKKESLRIKYQIVQNRKVVLFLHSIAEHRGAQFIPEIGQILQKDFNDILILVCGDGPYVSRMLEEIQERELTGVIKYLGPIPNADVPELFAVADVFINPALQEAFGRVLLEAMAMGVPFVSTDGGGGVLAFTNKKQQEFILPSGNIQFFCDKISILLNDENKRLQLIDEGFNIVNQFTLGSTVDKFAEIIKSNDH